MMTILFDLDGTLLDSTEGVIHAFLKMARLNKLSLSVDPSLFVGPPMTESLYKYFGFDFEKCLALTNHFREIYKNESLFKARLYDDVLDVLAGLKNMDTKLAVVTNKSHDNAYSLIEHFGLLKYFDYVIGSDLDGKNSKSNLILKCLNELKVSSKNTYYIGDSESDRVAARANGIKFIGVSYGFGYSPNDKKDYIYPSLKKAVLSIYSNFYQASELCAPRPI